MRPSFDNYRYAMEHETACDAELNRLRINAFNRYWPTHGPTDAVTAFSGAGDSPARSDVEPEGKDRYDAP